VGIFTYDPPGEWQDIKHLSTTHVIPGLHVSAQLCGPFMVNKVRAEGARPQLCVAWQEPSYDASINEILEVFKSLRARVVDCIVRKRLELNYWQRCEWRKRAVRWD
jgi:hypothetical protein